MKDLNLDGKVTVSDYKINANNWYMSDYEEVSNAVVSSSFGQFFELSPNGLVVDFFHALIFLWGAAFDLLYLLAPAIALVLVVVVVWLNSDSLVSWIRIVPKAFKSFRLKNLIFQSGFLSLLMALLTIVAILFEFETLAKITVIGCIVFLVLLLLFLFSDAFIDVVKEYKNKRKNRKD